MPPVGVALRGASGVPTTTFKLFVDWVVDVVWLMGGVGV